jgi:hypothetical protein
MVRMYNIAENIARIESQGHRSRKPTKEKRAEITVAGDVSIRH